MERPKLKKHHILFSTLFFDPNYWDKKQFTYYKRYNYDRWVYEEEKEKYIDYLEQKLSELDKDFNTSEANLTIPDVSNSGCNCETPIPTMKLKYREKIFCSACGYYIAT